MKKILFVITALEAGGAEKSLVNLLNMLDYTKYEVDLLLFKKEGPFVKQVPNEVNIVDIPEDLFYLYNAPKAAKNKLLAYKQAILRIAGTLYKKIFYKNLRYPGIQARWNGFYKKSLSVIEKEYDVAVSYMHGEAMYYVADKVNAKKKITWVHNDYTATKLNAKVDYPYFEKFEKVVTISDECVQIWKNNFPELQDRIECIPNLTSASFTRKLAKAYQPEEYADRVEKKIILSIGRLSYQKGFDVAVDIAKKMKDNGDKFVWYILGKGELKDMLTKKIEDTGVQDCFKLLGVRENPYPYVLNADIIAQPSRFEGKSVVLDEAKILCKPIVVANYDTVRDQIIDGQEGIIAKLDVECFANALSEVINNQSIQNKLSAYLSEHDYGNDDLIYMYDNLFGLIY